MVKLAWAARILTLLSLLWTALLTSGCGTLEIGIVGYAAEAQEGAHRMDAESTAEGSGPTVKPQTPTPAPAGWVGPTPEPAFTPMPIEGYAGPDNLHVAFIQHGDVWLWSSVSGAFRQITHAGDAGEPLKLSSDGEIVAFRRGDELWVVATDGANERKLLDKDPVSARESALIDSSLHRFEWVPGTHTLAFNTRQQGIDRRLADDLHLVDVDTMEYSTLLQPGEGGEFYYSPDGIQLAVVTKGDISLIDADGEWRRQSVLTYAPVAMYSSDDYYATPTWAADGSSLMVAIPPADPRGRPLAPTTIWRIPVDGSAAQHVASIASVETAGPVSFSPDLRLAAFHEPSPAAEGDGIVSAAGLTLQRLANGDWFGHVDGEFLGWAPNSLRFAMVVGREVPQLTIGQWSGPVFRAPLDSGIPVAGFRWLDNDNFLLEARRDWMQGASADSWDLVLGNVDGASTVLVERSEEFIEYDLALPTEPADK